MSDKPKRKNDQPIPRRYWWIFGILAIVLLISLRFPVNVLSEWWVNVALYLVLTLSCLLTLLHLLSYRQKRAIYIVIIGCMLLAGLHTYKSLVYTVMGVECHPQKPYITRCRMIVDNYYCADYVALDGLPIGISGSVGFTVCPNPR